MKVTGEVKRPELECITRKSDRGKKRKKGRIKQRVDAFRKQALNLLRRFPDLELEYTPLRKSSEIERNIKCKWKIFQRERGRQKKIEYKRFKKINKFIGIDFGRLLKSSRP